MRLRNRFLRRCGRVVAARVTIVETTCFKCPLSLALQEPRLLLLKEKLVKDLAEMISAEDRRLRVAAARVLQEIVQR